MIRIADPSRTLQRHRTIGPNDHGRLLTLEEYTGSTEEPGHTYELIDGVLNVSPMAPPPHDYWVQFVAARLREYAAVRPEKINYITQSAEVVVDSRLGPTRPIPDIAVYRDFPSPPPRRWDDVFPVLVVEVVSQRRARKDTDRNRHLYWSVKRITEYWIIDPSKVNDRPTMTALVRTPRTTQWTEQAVTFGKTYKSKALTGFSLNLDLQA